METSEAFTFAEMLKGFRNRADISQQHLADLLGMSRTTIGAWERCLYAPANRETVECVAVELHLTAEETDQLLIAAGYPPRYRGWVTTADGRRQAYHGFLRLDDGSLDAKVFVLDRKELIIGRDPTCDLLIPDRYCLTSRRHALITCNERSVYISDLSSKHHTFVEGTIVDEPWKLEAGQRILLGGKQAVPGVCVLEFLLEAIPTM